MIFFFDDQDSSCLYICVSESNDGVRLNLAFFNSYLNDHFVHVLSFENVHLIANLVKNLVV